MVTVVRTKEELDVAGIMITGHNLLALDCEGVELSRAGNVCIVQIATPSHCYLFDVLGLDRNSKVVLYVKRILEDPNIVKIIQ